MSNRVTQSKGIIIAMNLIEALAFILILKKMFNIQGYIKVKNQLNDQS